MWFLPFECLYTYSQTKANIKLAIVDPNTDIMLWESGAILTYLSEEYDTDKVLTYESLQDKHHLNQWLHFQVSGQGPYYGQAGW